GAVSRVGRAFDRGWESHCCKGGFALGSLLIVSQGRSFRLLQLWLCLFWHPLTCCGVVSISRRACQGFFSRIHNQVAFAIFLGDLQGIKGDAHILTAEAEKTAHTQYHSPDLTILAQKDVTDFADGVIG